MSVTIVPNVRSYEELTGGVGKEVFFRAPRVRARELFNLDTSFDSPSVVIGGKTCQLVNLSISGAAAIADEDDAAKFDVGNVVSFELRHAEAVLHHGEARIVRTEPVFRGIKVAVQLTDHPADLARLRQRYSEETVRRRVDAIVTTGADAVEAEYRVLCADVLFLLRTLKETLAIGTPIDPAAAEVFLRDCEERVWPTWSGFFLRGNDLLARARAQDGGAARMKAMTELLLTPEFLSAPIWRQTIQKPYGYPGDHVVMNHVYDALSEGETLYDKLMHRLGVRSLLLIQSRMRQIVEILKGKAALGPLEHPFRVLNLGCGAAREVSLFLKEGVPAQGALVTLLDQDSRALTLALEGAYREILGAGANGQVRCLLTTFAKLIEPGNLQQDVGAQDFIYSIGLLDYLTERRARALITALYGQLAPGGTLLVGNLRKCRESGEWCSEMICDWPMIFRTEDEMWRLASEIPTEAKRVFMEPLERVYLMQIEKPAH